jgi:hypothetical protein
VITPSTLLAHLPGGLRDPLLQEYKGIVAAHCEGRWKLSALDGGRFCEVVFTIVEGALSGTYAPAPSKPSRFPDACRALENKAPVSIGDRSLRILIPRVLVGLYEIRNNRNVGHVGGDVVSNRMDATFVRDSASWIVAELIRVFHNVTIDEAQNAVDALAERPNALIWEFEGIRRVLSTTMSASERALVMLYSQPGWTEVEQLQTWVKYKAKFQPQVLDKLADQLLVEIEPNGKRVVITPLGTKRAETIIARERNA